MHAIVEGINAAVEAQRQIAKDREEAAIFMNMLRRWNSDAYKTVDTELDAAMAEKKVLVLSFACTKNNEPHCGSSVRRPIVRRPI